MTEKERKHQYYLQHKDELIERARRWREKNPQRSKEIQAKSSAKWRSQNRDYINARSRELYRKRRANETPKEAEARRAKRRQQDAHWRRKVGIPERVLLCLTDEERHIREARRQRDRYHDPDKHEKLKQYERDRKRAYRKRKKLETTKQ